MNVTISEITDELHKAFHLFNAKWFDNSLPTPAITIQSNARRKQSMGWCSVKPVWGDKSGEYRLYEINLSAEFLDLDFHETMDTLLHEMVHLFHIVNDIQDTSRKGTYHNKHFKKKVLELGFEYESDQPDKKHGWSNARIGTKTKEAISEMEINADIFTISRKGAEYYQALEEGKSPDEVKTEGESKPQSSNFKWICKGCGLIMRSSKKEVKVQCMDCELPLEKEG